MINLEIIIFIILTICAIYLFNNINYKKKEKFTFEKIPLWTFFSNEYKSNNKNYKLFLDLCLDTFKKYNNDDFEIILIDEISLSRYLPDLPKKFNDYSFDLKCNYIKFKLLYEYGGLFVNLNTIVLTNFKLLTDKLIQYDFIGFGCKDEDFENNNYYSKPLLNVVGSRKNSILCKKMIDSFEEIFKKNNTNINLNEIRNLFLESLQYLIKNNNYEYYHYPPSYSGLYDNNNEKITLNKLISKEDINFDNCNIRFITIDFENIMANEILTEESIFYLKNNITTLFKKSLHPDHPNPELPLILNKKVEIYVLYIPKREVYIKNIIDRIFLNPTYFKGFNKNELNEDELIKDEFISREWTLNPKFNFGRVACHMGHMAILKDFLSKNTHKYALIFEDDIYIDLSNLNYYREKIINILNNIPEDAQAVYLSFCWERCNKTTKIDEIFSYSYKPLCRHMYLVSREGARIILKETKNLNKPGDNTIANLILEKKLLSYNVNPEYFHLEQNRQKLGSNLGNDKLYNICFVKPKKNSKDN